MSVESSADAPIDAAPDPAPDVPVADAGPGHVVFVTSATFNGNLGGLAGADDPCEALASAAGRVGTWRAILSDSTTDASARITVTGPIRDTVGTLVANNAADLSDGSIASPIARDENGAAVVPALSFVFTGTAADGTGNLSVALADRPFCNDWTSSAPSGVEAPPHGPYGLMVDRSLSRQPR